MTVARSSGCAVAAAASRSTRVGAEQVVPAERRRRARGRRGPRSTTIVARASGSSARTLRNALEEVDVLDDRDRRSQWPARYCDLLGRRGVVDRDRGRAERGARPCRRRGTRAGCASSARPGRPGRRRGPRAPAASAAGPVGVVGPGPARPRRRRPSSAGRRRRACAGRSRGSGWAPSGPGPAPPGPRSSPAPSVPPRVAAPICSACALRDAHRRRRTAQRRFHSVLHRALWKTWGEWWILSPAPSRGDRWGARAGLLYSDPPRGVSRSGARSAVGSSSSSASTASVSAPSGRPAWRTVAGRPSRAGRPAPASPRRRPRRATPRAATWGSASRSAIE